MSRTLSNLAEKPRVAARDYDVAAIRAQFPILKTTANGKPLIYLDNGATTQKPLAVIEAIDRYYREQNANIHRGVYSLSQLATDLYEESRRTIQRFINAKHSKEIIFTRGTTEGINLVAASYGRSRLGAGDEILVSAMEHHSDIVPWQILCEQTGATLRVIPMNDAGELLLDEYDKLLGERTKIVAIVHVSNSLGTINPAKQMIQMARGKSPAVVLIDAAQHVAHFVTDVQDLDVDFYCFSGHKLYGPTGIGVLYGKASLLEEMPPYMGGGDMIKSVTFQKTIYADLPNKLEAGTPHIEGGIALGAAIDWVLSVGLERMAAHEHDLLEYATRRLGEVRGLRIVGTAKQKASVISFVMESPAIGSYDIGVLLDQQGIAVRTGHHCCQPVMDRFGIAATARASFAAYNTREEVDALVEALKKIVDGYRVESAKPAAPIRAEQVVYPKASAASPQAAAEQLAEEFELFEDREAKSSYLLEDLAAKLPHYFDVLKLLTPRVEGCVAQVYLVGRPAPDDPKLLEFVADADAEVVRGLIVVMQRLFSGQRARDILDFDVESFFRRIGLDQFITQQRRNGLAGMVNKIRSLAGGIEKA